VSEELKRVFYLPMKKYLVSIDKFKNFAVYCKDTGVWKKVFGANTIKIAKNTPGTKLFFKNNGTIKSNPTKTYNLFIIK
jgi:hypothetical protein